MTSTDTMTGVQSPKLRRSLGLWDLILYGLIVVQPTAPMPVYGVINMRAHGHVVTTVLLAMGAMLFTAIGYGKMAQAYPSAGSAFSYVGREINPFLGYLTGWSMVMDYMLNPLICTILCSKFTLTFIPGIPYAFWVCVFILLFTFLNLHNIKTSARINTTLAATMGVVIVIFLVAAIRYVIQFTHSHDVTFFMNPLYDPSTFSLKAVLGGTSLAVLTYIGFDGISTLSEEVENPRRNILFATVGVCLLTGILASIEVYAAQLIWPACQTFPDVDIAFVYVALRAGGKWLFTILNLTLLIATIGSGIGSQLGAARLLYGMGRSNALPKAFFGSIEPKRHIPRNNVLLVGVVAFVGAMLLSYEHGAELVNFGALIAFMGVNASFFLHYYLRASRKTFGNLIIPIFGFTICLLLWLSLSWRAMLIGILWMVIGIAYGSYSTKGFRKEFMNFDISGTEELG